MNFKKTVSIFLTVCFVLLLSVFAAAENGVTIIAPTDPSSSSLVGGPLDSIPAGNYDNVFTGGNQAPAQQNIGGVIINTPSPEALVGTYPPVITKDPYSETKEVGESTSFIVHADNYTSVIWYVIDPATYQRHFAYEIGNYVEGVSCTGTESEQLFIHNISEKLDGWMFQADFSNASGTSSTAMARITVNAPVATPTPTPGPTPTPTPSPTPTPPAPTPTAMMPSSGGSGTTGSQTGTVTSGGSSTGSSGSMSSGSGAVMPTSGQQITTAGTTGSSGTTYTSLIDQQGSGITGTIAGVSSRNYMGAYIMAAAALLVILGAIAVMALYMRGKISLGKFEQAMEEDNNNGDGDEFYNPDDFKNA